VTHLADPPITVKNVRPAERPPERSAGAPGGTFPRLLRFALANLLRRPERALFAVVGIGLAIAAVVVVRTIAAGYQEAGVAAVAKAVDGASYWVVPEGGVRYGSGALLPSGPPPDVTAPPGWGAKVTRVGASGWVTLTTGASPAQVASVTGLRVVSDPAIRPAPGSGGLVYATGADNDRAGFLGFDQRFAALLGGEVNSSVLGLVAQVGLVLGFVIAVTSFVASVHERRREFGIMSSIGLSDEVLYFFMVESLIVFAAAYLLGVLTGGAVVAALLPSFFGVGAWLSASGLVAMYLPALGIVAALVPVHRILQQRPVQLLVEHQ
jgi:hypothetical protein